MGSTIYKTTYTCDCGQDYGDCGKIGVFLMEYNRSCDIGAIFVKRHPTDKMEYLGAFGDNALSALLKLVSTEGEGNITDEERKELRETQGW